jgi:hypothetical protein
MPRTCSDIGMVAHVTTDIIQLDHFRRLEKEKRYGVLVKIDSKKSWKEPGIVKEVDPRQKIMYC